MIIKFLQPNPYITQEQIGKEIEATVHHDFILGTSMEFRVSGVLVSVSSVENMPFFVKGTEEEIEQLKTIGFGKGSGMWGVFS